MSTRARSPSLFSKTISHGRFDSPRCSSRAAWQFTAKAASVRARPGGRPPTRGGRRSKALLNAPRRVLSLLLRSPHRAATRRWPTPLSCSLAEICGAVPPLRDFQVSSRSLPVPKKFATDCGFPLPIPMRSDAIGLGYGQTRQTSRPHWCTNSSLGMGKNRRKVVASSFAWGENGALYGKPILIKVSEGLSLSLSRGRIEARSMENYNWKVIKLK